MAPLGVTTVGWFGVHEVPVMNKRRQSTLDYWMLVILVEGEVELQQGERSLALSPGQGAILPPGSYHRELVSQPSKVAHLPFVVHGPPSIRDNPLHRLDLPRVVTLVDQGAAANRMEEIAIMDHTKIKGQKDYRNRNQRLWGNLVIYELLLNALAGGFAHHQLPREIITRREWIMDCRAYLKKHYKNADLTVGEVADHVGRSTGEVQRLFSATFGDTPKEWLHRYRISIATNLMLNNPNLTVEAIMGKCGYRSRSLMYRMFHRFVGCSPGQMRRK